MRRIAVVDDTRMKDFAQELTIMCSRMDKIESLKIQSSIQ